MKLEISGTKRRDQLTTLQQSGIQDKDKQPATRAGFASREPAPSPQQSPQALHFGAAEPSPSRCQRDDLLSAKLDRVNALQPSNYRERSFEPELPLSSGGHLRHRVQPIVRGARQREQAQEG
jgi:hypothetical protein